MAEVMPILADLTTYPSWLGLVHLAERVEGTADTFIVTIRAKVGPFARSKKLRMKRTELTESTVRFERSEIDGRHHSAWIMTIDANQAAGRTHLEIGLGYHGDLWIGPLEAILDSQADGAGPKLESYAQRVS